MNMRNRKTRFYLLDELAGWRSDSLENLAFSEEKNGLCLMEKPQALKDGLGTFAGFDIPTGFAVAISGGGFTIYILETENHGVVTLDSCGDELYTVKSLGGEGILPRQMKSPQGIAISASGNLYVADTGNHRIQVFAIKGLVLRSIWGAVDAGETPVAGTNPGEFDSPWDMAVDSHENVYVVDSGNNRVQVFNKNGTFKKEFGTGHLTNPRHIAIDREGRIYVGDDGSTVKVFSHKGEYLYDKTNRDEIAQEFQSALITMDSAGRFHYRIYTPICFSSFKTLSVPSVSSVAENNLTAEGMIPNMYYNNTTGQLIFSSDKLPEPVTDAPVYVKDGVLFTEALESGIYKCQWHKILLSADIPVGTGIMVETYTCESKKEILEIMDLADQVWQTRQLNADNFLIQSLHGRYLWLRITFKGNGKVTPVLKSVKVYYPRDSYLRYLPAIYRQEPVSRWFLERFLSIFQHFFTGYEEEITSIARYFNPMATDKEFLPWLGSWLGLVLEEPLPEKTKRELIKQAHELFLTRGTLKGLRQVLKIYTGGDFPIIEHFRMRRWTILGEQTVLGCNTFLWGNESALGDSTRLGYFKLMDGSAGQPDPFTTLAHQFTVIVPFSYCNTEEKERMINRVVELWKPAHTQWLLVKVKPEMRVGLQSMIGATTIIGKYPRVILGQVAQLGKESILGVLPGVSRSPGFVLNRRIQLNKTSIID